MSRSKWIAAALVALALPAVPAAQASDRTRVQITIAPSWGWGPTYRPAYRAEPRGYYGGYRVDRHDRGYGSPYGGPYVGQYGGQYGGQYRGYGGGPVIRFDYTDRGSYYGHGAYRPGGYLRYDSRRDRDYYRGHREGRRDWGRDNRGRDDRRGHDDRRGNDDRRGGDWRR